MCFPVLWLLSGILVLSGIYMDRSICLTKHNINSIWSVFTFCLLHENFWVLVYSKLHSNFFMDKSRFLPDLVFILDIWMQRTFFNKFVFISYSDWSVAFNLVFNLLQSIMIKLRTYDVTLCQTLTPLWILGQVYLDTGIWPACNMINRRFYQLPLFCR